MAGMKLQKRTIEELESEVERTLARHNEQLASWQLNRREQARAEAGCNDTNPHIIACNEAGEK